MLQIFRFYNDALQYNAECLFCFFRTSNLTSTRESSQQHKSVSKQTYNSDRIQNHLDFESKFSSDNQGMSDIKRNVSSTSIKSPNNGFMEVFGDSKQNFNAGFVNSGANSFMQQHGMEHTLKPSFPITSDSSRIDTRHFILASQGAIKVFGKSNSLEAYFIHN